MNVNYRVNTNKIIKIRIKTKDRINNNKLI